MKDYKALFMQLSYDMLGGDAIRDYYRDVYSCNPGYVMPPHFMEVPTWITYASGYLDNKVWEKELLIIDDVDVAVQKLNSIDRPTDVFISVMDSNKGVYLHIIEQVDNPDNIAWIAGGYTDLTPFDERGVVCLDKITDIGDVLYDTNIYYPPDYSLFNGEKHIPRLSLSDGCLYNCSFCTIERAITLYTPEEIQRQLDGFIDTRFELVYINDKTYGQASNWKSLRPIGKWIRKTNPDFRGFIVQTTVPVATKHAVEWFDDYYVRYVEVGVEIPNAEFLKTFRKPYNLEQLAEMSSMFRNNKHIGFIPNIIFGSPGDDYQDTLWWLYTHRDIIRFINPFILTTYENQKGSIGGTQYTDENSQENNPNRTWLTSKEQERMNAALDWALWLTNPVKNGADYEPKF